MKKLIGVVLICALTASVISGCAPSNIETTVTSEPGKTFPARPQDDYYYFVNKDALENSEFKYGSNYAGDAFDTSLVDSQIETVIREAASGTGYEKGSEEYVIQSAYKAFLDYDFATEPIPEELASLIDEVNKAETVDELLRLDAKAFRDFGVGSYFQISIEASIFSADGKMIVFNPINHVGSGFFSEMREDNFALNTLAGDIKTCMLTVGYDADTAEEYGKELALFTLELFSNTDMEIQDSENIYEYSKHYSADEISRLYSNIDLINNLKVIGFDTDYCQDYCLSDKGQAESLNSLMTDENIDALKAWKIFDIYSRYIRFIAPHYPELEIYVEDNYEEPEKQAINEIKDMFSSETDILYVEHFYTKETDDALLEMCNDIKEGYRYVITNADWLTELTRARLLEKLDNIVFITGMDLKRQDCSKYADLSGDYFDLMIGYNRIAFRDVIDSVAKPIDRKEVSGDMHMLNAFYNPAVNSVTICSAITNEPYFSCNADYYTNLGGLGSVIGHEIGHAFDSSGIYFDKTGTYSPDQIPDEDLKILKERDQKAVAYFEENFMVFGVYHVDGKQTLGENYADLGGMEVILTLAKTDEDLEKLFENYAICWCLKKTDKAIINQLAYDCHSPEVIRVNAILSTVDEFYELYGVKESDGMYIAPENRISRWY